MHTVLTSNHQINTQGYNERKKENKGSKPFFSIEQGYRHLKNKKLHKPAETQNDHRQRKNNTTKYVIHSSKLYHLNIKLRRGRERLKKRAAMYKK